MSYLFDFKGRINRAKIWLFVLICFLVEAATVVIAVYGFDWSDFLKSLAVVFKDLKPGGELDLDKVVGPKIAGAQSYAAIAAMFLLWLAVTWAGFAIFVKRLHDRNKSAWWLIPYWLVPQALSFYALFGTTSFWDAVNGWNTPLGYAANGVSSLIGLWVFVELYFFRGTRGENRFGPDPLA